MQELLSLTEAECYYIDGILCGLEDLPASDYSASEGAGQWIVRLLNSLDPKECLYFSRFKKPDEVLAAYFLARSVAPTPKEETSFDNLLFKKE